MEKITVLILLEVTKDEDGKSSNERLVGKYTIARRHYSLPKLMQLFIKLLQVCRAFK